MSLFDRYIAVDWSASNTPKAGRDSIWIGEVSRTGDTLQRHPSRNPGTRAAAMLDITATLLRSRERGERVLLGFDFVFGYPAGAAGAIAGSPDWRALWAYFAERVEDDDSNASNRFTLAAEINRRLGGSHFWGHPHQHRYDGLSPTRAAAAYGELPERRLAETRLRSVQPVWKLTGAGSVGSQALLGIPRLEALRRHPALASEIAIWPFETEFERELSKPICVVEIYPSMFHVPVADEVPRDRAQVEVCAGHYADLDSAGALASFLGPPDDLAAADREVVIAEEGWIAGVGHEALWQRRSPAATAAAVAAGYLRDPDAIYAESFATIAAEADLASLPPALRPPAIRMIHACGMVDLVADLDGDPGVVDAVRAALLGGATVFCDSEMVRAGIIARQLPRQNHIVVTLNEPAVPSLARQLGTTRSAAAVELWRDRLGKAVVVIGNAPTALFRLLELLHAGAPRPAAVIAAPVGFVGAAESKAALAASPLRLPYLTVHGRRGGSAIASAAFNAMTSGIDA